MIAKLRFDPVVSFGNLISIVAGASIAISAWYSVRADVRQLASDVARHESQIKIAETALTKLGESQNLIAQNLAVLTAIFKDRQAQSKTSY